MEDGIYFHACEITGTVMLASVLNCVNDELQVPEI